ncbi:MAG: protein translocase subunit SecD, partial [Clostridiales bacterium]|nr:protein translocase subunit SecD [Clostridiales bacterium]
MKRKVYAIVLGVVIAVIWFVTIVGIGPVGPIQKDIKLGLDISGGVYVVMQAETNKTGAELSQLMQQTQAVIERRVNAMGLSQPVITVEGNNRIRVEMPGVTDPEAAIQTIGQTAQLQFMTADGKVFVKGDQVTSSTAAQDTQKGGYKVDLTFNSAGADGFYQATKIAYEGGITDAQLMRDSDGNIRTDTDKNPISNRSVVIMLDNQIISAPVPQQDGISGGNVEITGNFTQQQATELAALIRGGSLPVQLKEVESSAIGATIGMGAFQESILGGAIGILLVFALMLFMFRFMGLGACISLLLFVPLLFWAIVGLGGVLTLPGIAGIFLSVGMAVDTNVIVFSRIKDEVWDGKSLKISTRSGFRKAIHTVFDSQLTTLIAGIVLYVFGDGDVKGFALTLIIGIVLGLFTGLVITSVFVNAFEDSPAIVNRGWLGVQDGKKPILAHLPRTFHFIKHRRVFYTISIIILAVGLSVGFGRGFNMGIDFTGGTMLQIDLGQRVTTAQVAGTLAKGGVTNADITSFGTNQEGVVIKTTQALTAADRDRIMSYFEKDFGVKADALQTFEQFGPSVGQTLTNNAILSIALAAVFMLLYIVIRFQFKFGLAATITTFHDVAILVAMYGLFHMTVNNPFIASILTLV